MDKKQIRDLLEKGVKFSDIPQDKAIVKLSQEITAMFIQNGLHRQISTDAFTQEVRVATSGLYNELMTDPAYKSIRDTEINYIFSEGMKGRLGTDKDIVITYKSILRWIEGYVNHAERREALAIRAKETYVEPKRQIPRSIVTDDDIMADIKQAMQDYLDYKRMKIERMSSKLPLKIGELAMPYRVKDLGGSKMKFLVRQGLANDGEEFVDVIERAIKNNGEFKKV